MSAEELAFERNPAFKTARDESSSLPKFEKSSDNPTNEQLLLLYALFKIGKGDDITKAPSVGMFQIQQKHMRAEWQKKVDEGVTQEAAQQLYIEEVEKMKKDVAEKIANGCKVKEGN